MSRFRYRLDAKQAPKEIDLIFVGRDDALQKGVWALEGDRLLICWSKLGSANRPTELAAKPGSDRILTIYKREITARKQKQAGPRSKAANEQWTSRLAQFKQGRGTQ